MAEAFGTMQTEESRQKVIDDYFYLIELAMQNAEYKGWKECLDWQQEYRRKQLKKALAE